MDLASPQAEALRLAGEALARLDPDTALGHLDRADSFGPSHNGTLNRALAFRLKGDFPAALRQIDKALAFQPYDFIALLAKGALLEKVGQNRKAVPVYRTP